MLIYYMGGGLYFVDFTFAIGVQGIRPFPFFAHQVVSVVEGLVAAVGRYGGTITL